MATTEIAARLTEAHRIEQARLGAQTVQQFLPTWQLLDPTNLDAGVEQWLHVTTPIVQAAKTTSARLTGNYYTTFRTLETGLGHFDPTIADTVNPTQLQTSLLVTGPYRLKAASARGVPIAQALIAAKASTAGAVMRQALAGGRDTLSQSVTDDKRAIGWARATSGSACFFCQMLASRGPVYSDDSVDFEAHDHCTCSGEPSFSTDQAWPSGSREMRDRWNQATAGLGGQDAITAFRNALSS